MPADDRAAEEMPRPPEFPPPLPGGADHAAGEPTTPLAAAHQELTRVHDDYLRVQHQIVDLLAQRRARRIDTGARGRSPAAKPLAPLVVETDLDPQAEPWLGDHSPLGTTPVLPITCVADHLVRAAEQHTGRTVRGLRQVQMRRWLPVDGRTRIRLRCDRDSVGLDLWWAAANPALSRFVPVATATPSFEAGPRPDRFAALTEAEPMPDPYATGELFHGPAFQGLTSARVGPAGATAVLDAARGSVPYGSLHAGLLDAALHVLTPTTLRRWIPELTADTMAFPHRIDALEIHQPLPDRGPVEAEARFVDTGSARPGDPLLIMVDVQLCRNDQVLVAFRIVFIDLPAGPLAGVSPARRRDHLRDRVFVPELLLSHLDGPETVVHRDAIAAFDQVPGTATAVYALRSGPALPQIAAKEHLGRKLGVHPGRIGLDDDLRHARYDGRSWPIVVAHDRDSARVRDRPDPDALIPTA